MRNLNTNILKFDWKIIFLYLLLVFIGWLNIYATTKSHTHFEIFDFSTRYGKQIIWIALSIVLIILILFLDTRFYIQFSSIIYLLGILSLVGLFLFGKKVNGATSWYAFGNFSFQPSEFVKIATALGVAKLIGEKQFDMEILRNQLKVFLLITIPAILIILQPDQGSALVFLAFFFVFYREGLPRYYIYTGFISIVLSLLIIKFGFVIMLIIITLLCIAFLSYLNNKNKYNLRKYWLQYLVIYLIATIFTLSTHYIYNNGLPQRHKDRIDLSLNIIKDTKGKGYNTLQSEIAIGSGGFLGQGYLKGSQTHGKFVPEQDTDYIFSAVAEEWGFIGGSFVIILYMLFILRIIKIAEAQKSKFSRVYGYSIASIFLIHFTINVGMVIGIVPTIGIPLPFMSYGGSSLWAFTALLFIFIRLDANKSNEW
ncbi:MAG: rod shape-determining protein RodA [Flavobacteriaceae bacterium]|nr:rod shape-determining protein RodA [Flavobacteriaceae bacterium]